MRHPIHLILISALSIISTACRSDNQAAPISPPTSEEVSLETPTGTLYGTLQLPSNQGTFPVALIIAGSGPTDRNGNSMVGISSNYLKMIADSLAQQGIASLRYDKRGVAASSAAALNEADLRFDDYVDDATQWIDYLRANERLREVIVIGHSEGSLVGMLAAEQRETAAYVSIAGAARPADSLIIDQLRTQPTTIQGEAESILQELRAERTVDTVSATLRALFRPSVQPYLISWIKYNPSEIIAELSQPVLIVQGTTDLQVPEAEGRRLAQAQPNARLAIIAGMNHVLKEAPADPAANVATYSDPTLPLAP